MRDRSRLVLLAAFSLSIAACGGGSESPAGAGGNTGGSGGSGNAGGSSGGAGGSGSGGLPCDVDAILQAHCQQCHAPKPVFGAPMPLVTWDDLHAPLKSDASKKVYEQVGVRIHDDKNPMPQPPNPRLSDADASVLDTWIAAGAPKGSGDCGGTGGSGGGTGTGGTGGAGLSCTPDVKLQAATPWVMPKDTTDIYVCYGVDLTFDKKRQAIALAPLIDNATIVHHMLLFSAKSSYGSTPKPCSGSNMGALIGVWAPGGGALELPPEAGYPLDGTAHFVLQVHYSNLMHLDGQKDLSGYQLCTTDQLRPNDADILAFGTWQFTVPAQGSADITCDLTLPGVTPTLHGIAGMPHMHKLGKALSTTLHKADGSPDVDLGTANPWNFQSQVWTMLGDNAVLKPGDKVSTRCAWDNPTSSDVHFGETTSDEMCFGFLMYYPRIAVQGWQWGAPAAGSTCQPTK
jgi:cytochrome c551/c552